MSFNIDHVTIAGSGLAHLQRVFAEIGMETDYGGLHSNGATHMALLGFADGSYVELISTFAADKPSPLWGAHIAGDGGPCGWAVGTDDPDSEARRLRELGVPVRGPVPLERRRADGALVEWDLVYVGDGEPGATLPFLIKDRTPREWRVRPSASVAGTELTGVAVVVLGVDDLAASVDLFRRVYGLPAPALDDREEFGARLAWFTGTPVALAAPSDEGGWLGRRTARFGPCPAAYLIDTADFDATSARFRLARPDPWFGRRMGWIDPERLHGPRLGVIADRA